MALTGGPPTSLAGVEQPHLGRALDMIRTVAIDAPAGYVPLQEIAYRTHHLLAAAVLAHTQPGDAIFEAGVSSGYFARVMTTSGRVVDGFDIDAELAAEARSVCRSVHIGDLETYDLSLLGADYQLLLFGDTLEHLRDPADVLSRLRERLRPGGALVLSVPNVANWAMRLSLLAGRWTYRDLGILDRTHLRFFTRRTIAELVASAGFDVQSVTAAVPVPGVSSSGAARLAHRIGNVAPGLFAYQHIVIARA